MKKPATNTTGDIKTRLISTKKNTSKTHSGYTYTEADLGEDILELSHSSMFSTTNKFTKNMYNQASYSFQ